jgi:hypothetical protein
VTDEDGAPLQVAADVDAAEGARTRWSVGTCQSLRRARRASSRSTLVERGEVTLRACGNCATTEVRRRGSRLNSTGAEATRVATEAYKKADPYAPICDNSDAPWRRTAPAVAGTRANPITCYE